MKERIQRLREIKEAAALGGGKEKIDREHKKGKLTARERIDLLIDPGSFNEFNMLINHKVGAPGDGIVCGHGTIEGRTVCVFSQDAALYGTWARRPRRTNPGNALDATRTSATS